MHEHALKVHNVVGVRIYIYGDDEGANHTNAFHRRCGSFSMDYFTLHRSFLCLFTNFYILDVVIGLSECDSTIAKNFLFAHRTKCKTSLIVEIIKVKFSTDLTYSFTSVTMRLLNCPSFDSFSSFRMFLLLYQIYSQISVYKNDQ